MISSAPRQILDRARLIRLLVMDVDGVLTDGTLYYSNAGEELKAFSILDGLGIKLLHESGIGSAIITGRRSELVARRAAELGIEQVVQGREDKQRALIELHTSLKFRLEEIAYIGDDLPDLGAICSVGLGIAVANAHPFVAQHAHWQTRARGGSGAVREACELIMRAQDTLAALQERYLPKS